VRVIVTGTGGRLGAAVARHLRDRHRVVAYDRRAVDLRCPEQIDDHFSALEFDAVIHCAALTQVDYAEQHPEEARAVNAAAPGRIAAHCARRGARMIHVSTDYVYDGTAPGLRRESDPALPLSVYGRTKLEGEQRVLEQSAHFIAARTSWVFGPDRPSFVDHIIARARKEPACAAVADKFSSPSYSADMAEQLERLLTAPEGGIYNLSNDGSCTWQALGQAALDTVSALGWRLRCRTLDPLPLAEMKSFIAPRPVHTALDLNRLAAATGLRPRPWQDALTEYLTTTFGPAAS
jgi:dTDP-4-dehydrorhamnose reductase